MKKISLIFFSFLFLIGAMIVPTSAFSQVAEPGEVSIPDSVRGNQWVEPARTPTGQGVTQEKGAVVTENEEVAKAKNFTPAYAERFGLFGVFVPKDITLKPQISKKRQHKVYEHQDSISVEVVVIPGNVVIGVASKPRFFHIETASWRKITFKRIGAEYMAGPLPLDFEFKWNKKDKRYYLATRRINVGGRSFRVAGSGVDGNTSLYFYHKQKTSTEQNRVLGQE